MKGIYDRIAMAEVVGVVGGGVEVLGSEFVGCDIPDWLGDSLLWLLACVGAVGGDRVWRDDLSTNVDPQNEE